MTIGHYWHLHVQSVSSRLCRGTVWNNDAQDVHHSDLAKDVVEVTHGTVGCTRAEQKAKQRKGDADLSAVTRRNSFHNVLLPEQNSSHVDGGFTGIDEHQCVEERQRVLVEATHSRESTLRYHTVRI